MKNEFISSIEQLCREKNLDKTTLLEAIETAVVAALKRKYSQECEIFFRIDDETGVFDVSFEKEVVEKVRDKSLEISLTDAIKIQEDAKVGQRIHVPIDIQTIARITAQTAKQIIMQRVRDVEKASLMDEYRERIGELILAPVERVEARRVVLSMGECDGVLLQSDILPTDTYKQGDVVKAVIRDVQLSRRGDVQILLSRTSEQFLLQLFREEVPEISSSNVVIKAVAREGGSRSKIAVKALKSGMDPVGACVGVKGSRVSAVVEEIGGEKIDIIEWSDEPALFICNALNPAEVVKMDIYDEEGVAVVVVPERQLSLAIGRKGQNARLAAKLTNWKIDIYSEEEYEAYLRGETPQARRSSDPTQSVQIQPVANSSLAEEQEES
ncbi:transcription termination factor NusA [Desulfurispirillum indicum]|uniref:Transcription termination/antitermination protein NusA n=1 Tax=Desulfurispirillum indicum (strain ATCC BAA-1389 / DSM 22839 / S5) TaxID=653733 RepID=E6W7D3_DESIS|nr:transcription termination factor NusA [Desulfurispirillum indicum]ADU66300.1 transcription termination factor NusA [Desulfurispirillum indicum S5]UCZ55634.1 transcription termination factor NusA [Desulfurispirillum indicum]